MIGAATIFLGVWGSLLDEGSSFDRFGDFSIVGESRCGSSWSCFVKHTYIYIYTCIYCFVVSRSSGIVIIRTPSVLKLRGLGSGFGFQGVGCRCLGFRVYGVEVWGFLVFRVGSGGADCQGSGWLNV